MVCLKVKSFLVTRPSFLQDPSNQLSPKQPETDVYDNVSKQQLYADVSAQSGSDPQTDSSSRTESSEAPFSNNNMLADSTQPNASGPKESNSFQQMTPNSKEGGIKSHELQDLCGQVQHESDGSDKEAQLGEDISHIQSQSDLEMYTKDSVDREVQGGDPTNHPNSPLDDELSPQSISASDDNGSATECSKEGIYSFYQYNACGFSMPISS